MPGKRILVYVTGNIVLGGGDQILVAHARALQASDFKIVLFSLEPVASGPSLAGELKSLGVTISHSPFVDRFVLPLCACILVPAVVVSSFMKAGVVLARALAGDKAGKPPQQAVVQAKTLMRLPYSRAKMRMCRWLLRKRVSRFFRSHDVAGLHVFHAAACQSLGKEVVCYGVKSFYTEILTPISYFETFPELAHLLPLYSRIVVPAQMIGHQLSSVLGLRHDYCLVPFLVKLDVAEQGLSYQNSRFQYGVIARLSPEKGHRCLLRAGRIIKEQCPSARLLLAGDGPLREEITLFASENGIVDRVQFLGAFTPSDLPQIMAQIDVFVLPSHVEGMPHVLVEAMAYGKPIVATPVGAVPEMVLDGENGFLVPVDDSQALAERVTELLLDSALRERMGRRGRALYEERYDYEKMLAQIRALYGGLTAEREGAA